VSHKQKALEHLRQAERLQERLERIEEAAVRATRGSDPYLADKLDDDPQDMSAKNQLAYQVGLRLEKYQHVMANMVSSRNRHIQWAQTYAVMEMMDPEPTVVLPKVDWNP
jgi:hypothetical protein